MILCVSSSVCHMISPLCKPVMAMSFPMCKRVGLLVQASMPCRWAQSSLRKLHQWRTADRVPSPPSVTWSTSGLHWSRTTSARCRGESGTVCKHRLELHFSECLPVSNTSAYTWECVCTPGQQFHIQTLSQKPSVCERALALFLIVYVNDITLSTVYVPPNVDQFRQGTQNSQATLVNLNTGLVINPIGEMKRSYAYGKKPSNCCVEWHAFCRQSHIN